MPSIRELLTGKYARDIFLTGIVLGFGAVASIVLGIPIVGYLLTPLIKPTPQIWENVGALKSFKPGTTREITFTEPYSTTWAGSTTLQGAWLRRLPEDQGSGVVIYSMYCTHLGCPIHWLPGAQRFLCPCHGSAFNADGTVAAGPAELPLVQLKHRIVKRTGQVQVLTSPLPVA